MKLYDFVCECGRKSPDVLVKDSGEKVLCSKCGREMKVAPSVPKVSMALNYQPAAIMADGSRVKGHWGQTSRKRGRTC